MAYKTKKKFVPRRKFVKKRRVVRKSNIPRGVNTMANIPRIQRHRYCQPFSITSTVSAPGIYRFAANDMNDPGASGGGHQPMRFDEMKLFYNHYVVVGSRITVTYTGSTTTAATSNPVVWSVFLNDDGSSPPSYTAAIEQGRTTYRHLNTTNAVARSTIHRNFSAKKFFNVANIKDNVDRLGAGVTASPTELAFFDVAVQSLDTGVAATINCLAVMDFIVLYSEPTDVAQS